MSVFGALFNSIALRCLGAVVAGALVVTAFSGLLSLYGEAQDTLVEISTQTLKFPTDERSLDDLSDRLARGAEILNNIAPSSGR